MFTWLDKISGRELLRRAASGIERVEKKMASVEESLATLNAAVSGVADRVDALSKDNADRVAELEAAIAAERDAAVALAATEDAEDVGQNAALDEARTATDAALAEVQGVASAIDEQAARLNDVAAAPAEEVPTLPVEDEVPADEAPVNEDGTPAQA